MRRHGANGMTGQRFLQLQGAPDPAEMLEICGDMLEAGARPLVKAGRLKGKLVIAADEHAIPRCDKGENGDLKGGKRKGVAAARNTRSPPPAAFRGATP